MKVHVSLEIGDPMEAMNVLAALAGIKLMPLEGATQTEGSALVGADGKTPLADTTSGIITEEAPPKPVPPFAEVEQAVYRKSKGPDGIPGTKAVLAQFGVERARELQPEQYADFIAACA